MVIFLKVEVYMHMNSECTHRHTNCPPFLFKHFQEVMNSKRVENYWVKIS